MNVTLATFLCVDTDAARDASWYPAIGRTVSSDARRAIYWKNVLVSCATARRCAPDARVCVYTNDDADLDLNGASLHDVLNKLSVTRVFLPYEKFVPPQGASRKFRNAYYRFDVIQALAEQAGTEDALILHDSDCVWIRAVNDLARKIPVQGLWLSAPRPLYPPQLRYPFKQSRADFGALYRAISPAYPEPFPKYYGGEFIGGRRAAFQQLRAELEWVWQRVAAMNCQAPVRLANGEGIYDNDEYILNFICNRGVMPVTLTTGWMRRIQTLEGLRDVRLADMDLTLWHLPSEKRRGLLSLTAQALDRASPFWQTPLAEFANYLGAYVGIPKRRYDVPYTARARAEYYARNVARGIRGRLEYHKAFITHAIEKSSRRHL